MAWQDDLIPPDMSFEQNGQQIPAREYPFIKESPDFQTFIKRAVDSHRETGSRIPVKIERIRAEDGTFKPNTEAIAKWHADHMPKLYEAGILQKPPSKPEEYEIKRPEALPDGIGWKDEHGTKLSSILHKYGVPKAAVPELLDLHKEALLGVQHELKTDYDTAMLELKKEFGADTERKMEDSKRLTSYILKSDEDVKFLEDTGLGNHPRFLSILMRLAPFVNQDQSLVAQIGAAGGQKMTGDEIRAIVADIMSNPKNERHAGYHRNDKTVMDYIEKLYKDAYGEGKVPIGGGLRVGG